MYTFGIIIIWIGGDLLKKHLTCMQVILTTIVFLLVTGYGFSTTAAASSTVISNEPLQTATNTRNYLPTGTQPLYNKIPGQQGAKISVKAANLKALATATDQGQTYFRGYRVAQTSDGKFYMKVVSFDKTYRGWIYIGTTNPTTDSSHVTEGVNPVQTFKTQAPSAVITDTTFYFTTPKASTLTYTAPDWTQYKVGRNLNATTAYVNDALKVTQMGTKQNNRDGNATYYYVTDTAHPQVNGWVKASAVTTVKPNFNY